MAAPPKAPGNMPGVTWAGQTSELLRLQSKNELLKGNVKLRKGQMVDPTHWLVCVARGNGPMSCSRSATASCWQSAPWPTRRNGVGEPARRNCRTS